MPTFRLLFRVCCLGFLCFQLLSCQHEVGNGTPSALNLPDRPLGAISGSAFARQVAELNLADREKAVVQEILAGNVPVFSRRFQPLMITEIIDGEKYECQFYVTQDYLAIGSTADYLYIPLTPSTAQHLADQLNCILPTAKMVDLIYREAGIQLAPQPIPPSDSMTTIPIFRQHTDSIVWQMQQKGIDRLDNQTIAGHKKDIIISNKIYQTDKALGSVVIYGWHLGVDDPIQPVYNGHHGLYADYSHGTRLVFETGLVNGTTVRVDSLLRHPDWAPLLSKEGVLLRPFYPESTLFLR